VDLAPIRAALGDGIGGEFALARGREVVEAGGAVGGELVGIEEDARGAVEALLHVDDRLVLQAVVF